MLDTNVFNWVLKGKISPRVFEGHELFSTYLQTQELEATPGGNDRRALLQVFQALAPDATRPVAAIAGIAIADLVYPTDGVLLDQIFLALQARQPRRVAANRTDAMIAESAYYGDLTLVSADRALVEAARENGVSVIELSSLMAAGGGVFASGDSSS